MDIYLLLGRLHPLMVHLPIGFIFLIVIFEFYAGFLKQEMNKKLVTMGWFFCFLSSLFTAITGYLLSSRGHYIEENLAFHKILGFVLVGITFFSWVIRISFPFQFDLNFKKKSILNSVLIVFLLVTGHLGGNLTHGKEYLTEFLPEKNKTVPALSVHTPLTKSVDSVRIYKDLIHPIFEAKCLSCHNSNFNRGGLNMTSFVALKKGGSSGNLLNQLDPRKSLLFKRITLPTHEIKFMPPDGEPISFDEKNLILWWIENLEQSEEVIQPEEVSTEIKLILNQLYGLDLKEKNWYERIDVPKLELTILEKFDPTIFEIKHLSSLQKFVTVTFLKKNIREEDFKSLLAIKDNIVKMKLPQCELNNSNVSQLKNFKNLVQLDLKDNPVKDQTISSLQVLENLEVLNLVGTKITDESFLVFENFKNLKRVYVWQTSIQKIFIEEFNKKQDKVKLIGASF